MITSINEYKKYLESSNNKDINVYIYNSDELKSEINKDETINDRIRFFYINDLYSKNLQYFVVLKDGDKVIGIARVAYFSLSSITENNLSIAYFSIDKEYRYKGYAKLIADKLFKHAKENNYIISTSSYTVLGKLQLKKLFNKYANKYGVKFIDKDEMIDTDSHYKTKDGKLYHYSELNESYNDLIEVKVNKYIYHTSNPKFRDKISKYGLVPKGKSETWLSDTKIDGKVIFVINSDKKEDIWDSGYDDDLYKIDTTKLNNKWYKDPNFVSGIYTNNNSKAIITFEPIPNNAIKLIHKGTGLSIDENKLNESVEFNNNLKFDNQHINYHNDQHVYKLIAYLNNKEVGHVDYHEYRGKIFIDMIESNLPKHNVGPSMMIWLANKYGYENIERTHFTEAGLKLRQKMDKYFNFNYVEYKKSQNKHLDKNIISKIANKHPLLAQFMLDMLLHGNDKTWDKWRDKISNNVFDYLKELDLDLNDVIDIISWIKYSPINDNLPTESVPKIILQNLQKLY